MEREHTLDFVGLSRRTAAGHERGRLFLDRIIAPVRRKGAISSGGGKPSDRGS